MKAKFRWSDSSGADVNIDLACRDAPKVASAVTPVADGNSN